MVLPETMRIDASGNLVIGGITAGRLARRFATPLYAYDEGLIRKRCREYRSALSEVYPRSSISYAAKAFMTMAIARIMDQEGFGLDLVSGGEIYTALEAGFPPGRIQFNGSNKTDEELAMAVESGIGQIIVDGFGELDSLIRIAKRQGTVQPVLLRVTPGVEAHTHSYVQTGKEDSKFGFSLADGQAMRAVRAALRAGCLRLQGIHCHIGSQVFELTPFSLAASTMLDFRAEVLKETGHLLEQLNMGGGLGIRYLDTDNPPGIAEYAALLGGAVREACERHSMPLPTLQLEPGRSIVGEAGVTLYRAGTIKEVPGIRTYVSVDGGMTDNPRPALYEAKYRAILAERGNETPSRHYSVAGRCCESGDMLIWDAELPEVKRGDLLAVFSTGAYHYAMASNYNSYPRPAVVLVNAGQAHIIVERESYQDIVARDCIPRHLETLASEAMEAR